MSPLITLIPDKTSRPSNQ